MLRRVSVNFYIMTRTGLHWTKEEIAILKKYIIKDIYFPIPKDFVNDSIIGCYYEGRCISRSSKMVMLNFDIIDGKKGSLRGIAGVNFSNDENGKSNILIRMIGCNSIKNTPSASAKSRNKIIMKTGKDMMLWWQQFAVKGKFAYIKLNGMEDVIGFYWKLGWRFLQHPKSKHAASETHWRERIKKLNVINSLKGVDPCWVEKERSGILEKYFDRFLEGYYSDNELKNYRNRDDIYDIYDLKGTRKRHHLGLRYHGYKMYWFVS